MSISANIITAYNNNNGVSRKLARPSLGRSLCATIRRDLNSCNSDGIYRSILQYELALLQLAIEIENRALRCSSNAQQRERCAPFIDILASILDSANSLNFDLMA